MMHQANTLVDKKLVDMTIAESDRGTPEHVFGLDNIGFTCYLNTTLQCMFSFENFVEDISSQRQDATQAISLSLRNIISGDRRKSLKSLIRALMQKVNYFRFLQHNDINEFITLFFEQINMEIYNFNKLDIRPVKQSLNSSLLSHFLSKAHKSWYNFVKNENTWFNDMCTGQLVHQIICGNCKKIHHNFETFRLLDVDLPPNMDQRQCSLDDALDHYFRKQYINSDDDEDPNQDRWVCDGCNESRQSVKSCKIVRTPAMFIISLKRFKMMNGKFVKNNQHVKIHSSIDLNDHSVGFDENFELRAVANHIGGMNRGHYNAYCMRQGSWYLMDDEDTRKVKSYDDQHAYTVFFKKNT